MKRKGFIKTLALALMSSVLVLGGFSMTARADLKSEAVSVNSETASKKVVFKDSLDREIELPGKIDRIAPSGGLANFVLYTLCPEKLVSSGNGFSEKAKDFIPEKYMKLPRTGSLYGRKATILPEEIIKLKPQVIIDIGEIKGNKEEMAAELNKFQKTVNIPTIMVEASVEKTLSEAYRTLGRLVGKEKEAEVLAKFCEKVMNRADRTARKIPYSKKIKVYWAVGKDGLQTEVKGKMNVLPIDKVGGLNVVNLPTNYGSTKSVTMEQLLVWKPDVIIAESRTVANHIKNDNLWKLLPAVKNNKVYVVPSLPYSFMASPPASNQLLGIIWLGNILYPEYNKYNMREEIVEFYDLFYHINLGEPKLKEILSEK